MKGIGLFLLLTILCGNVVLAQAGPPWPRDAATGKIVFKGLLPWPANIGPDLRKQALVRRWYQLNLTNSALPVGAPPAGKTTYGGLPQAACLRLGSEATDEDYYHLCFQVQLVPDQRGLLYQLTDFQLTRGQGDVGEVGSVEHELTQQLPDLQLVLRQFCRRLLAAEAGW